MPSVSSSSVPSFARMAVVAAAPPAASAAVTPSNHVDGFGGRPADAFSQGKSNAQGGAGISSSYVPNAFHGMNPASVALAAALPPPSIGQAQFAYAQAGWLAGHPSASTPSPLLVASTMREPPPLMFATPHFAFGGNVGASGTIANTRHELVATRFLTGLPSYPMTTQLQRNIVSIDALPSGADLSTAPQPNYLHSAL